jgi:hypothetical protein
MRSFFDFPSVVFPGDRIMISNTVVRFVACLIVVACELPANATVTNTYWQHDMATSGDWFESLNWTAGLPAYKLDYYAYIDNGGTAVIQSGTASQHHLYVGYNNVGNLLQTGGTSRSYPSYGGNVVLGYNSGSQGTFTLESGTFSPYNFAIGFWGEGVMNQSGGTAQMNVVTIGYYAGTGSYSQSGGSVEAESVYVGNGTGSTASYSLSNNGSLKAYDSLYVGRYGTGDFLQTGGIVNVSSTLSLGDQSTGYGNYSIWAGSLNISGTLSLSLGGTSQLTVHGNQSTITAGQYSQGAKGTLVSVLDQSGISTISVLGKTTLSGNWIIEDDGAGLGQFNVLTSGQGISGSFSNITMPGPDWTWGIDNGNTLWIQHVPEPSTIALLLTATLGGLLWWWRRR